MASQMWHKMNNVVAEMERNRERIVCATLHLNNNPGSLARNLLNELKAKHDALYDQLYDLSTEALERFEKDGTML